MINSDAMRLNGLSVLNHLSKFANKLSRYAIRWCVIIALVCAQFFIMTVVSADDNYIDDGSVDSHVDASHVNASRSSSQKSTDPHAMLSDIITSSDFAKVSEDKQWKRVNKPEEESSSRLQEAIKNFLEFLFGDYDGTINDNESRSWFWLYSVIKLLLILGLIVFIIWVLRKASVQAWFASIKNQLTAKPKVSTFDPSLLPQSWEDLPPHDDIPVIVQKLLHKNDIVQAASVLYRGSLRWLNKNHHVTISPATTEKQCLNQVVQVSQVTRVSQTAQISDKSQFSKFTLDISSVNYVTQIIHLWLKIAYDSQINPINTAKQSDDEGMVLQHLKQQLMTVTETWLSNLPPTTPTTSGTSNNTDTKHALLTKTRRHAGGNQ